jgi:predicted metal-binding membrane protein
VLFADWIVSKPGTAVGPKASRSSVEAIFRRDRGVTIGGIILLTVLSWAYLFGLAAGMDGMVMEGDRMSSVSGLMGPQLSTWSARDFFFMFLMWSVMMVAMMLPSASPLILLHVRVNRQQEDSGDGFHGTVAFAIGYLLAWTSFSAGATLLQWGLERLAVLSPMMVSTSPLLGSGLLLAAGIYQFTPFKDACLRHCRSPVHFLMQHWRRGTSGAFMMGFHHGVYCIGCCWLLMALLFVFGVMNLVWIAVLSAFVLLEKVVSRGELVARVAGVVFIVAGIFILSGRV